MNTYTQNKNEAAENLGIYDEEKGLGEFDTHIFRTNGTEANGFQNLEVEEATNIKKL